MGAAGVRMAAKSGSDSKASARWMYDLVRMRVSNGDDKRSSAGFNSLTMIILNGKIQCQLFRVSRNYSNDSTEVDIFNLLFNNL